MPTERRVEDGLCLVGDVVMPDTTPDVGVLLVHGRGATRHESGFFDRIAEALAAAGIASLRFDLRGHGESEGTQEDVTLAGLLNDVRAGFEVLRAETGVVTTSLVGQSFSGGVCAYYAAKRPAEVRRLVMLCPRIDYKARTIDGRPYWVDDHLDDEHADLLTRDGFCSTRRRSGTASSGSRPSARGTTRSGPPTPEVAALFPDWVRAVPGSPARPGEVQFLRRASPSSSW